MELAVRRFARNILLIHLALLAVVLGIVYIASRAIEDGAREQALGQAQRRQEQLTVTTARGIEEFYRNIMDDMDLLPRTDARAPESRPALESNGGERDIPAAEENPFEQSVLTELGGKTAPGTPLGERGSLIGFVLARQLEDRVSHLFVLDRRNMRPYGLLREDLEEELKLGRARPVPPPPAPEPTTRPNRAAIARLRASGPQPTPTELEIVRRNEQWLKELRTQGISPFEVFDAGGCNLIALPLMTPDRPGGPPQQQRGAGGGGGGGGGDRQGARRGRGPGGGVFASPQRPTAAAAADDGSLAPKSHLVVVATVPVEKINDRFLSRLNNDRYTGAFLVDESMTTMAASRPGLVGANLSSVGDAQVRALIDDYHREGMTGTKRLAQPFKLGDHDFEPAMVTSQPIEVAGKRWFLLVASPLSEVDRVVSALFDRIVLWSVFVTAAIAALLVSTAVQLIRSRVKLERERAAAIRRELERARQIQQAWLPHQPPLSRALDVAAVNYPAQHISGDFYNWFELPDGRTAIAIGDVTGHGMSAAFLMATTQLLVRTTLARITDPGRCLAEVNRQLCTQVYAGQFVTLQLLVVEPETGTVELANAGHPPPLVGEPADDSGAMTFRALRVEPQFVLGVEEDATYDTERVDLPPGALLLLYTDGAADAEAPDGRRFGAEGLRKALPATRRPEARPMDARGLLDTLVRAINDFRGKQALGDDLTFVAVRLNTVPAASEPEPVGATR
jgi:serine phosphatase RsbU (regulator of sigma subunit)